MKHLETIITGSTVPVDVYTSLDIFPASSLRVRTSEKGGTCQPLCLVAGSGNTSIQQVRASIISNRTRRELQGLEYLSEMPDTILDTFQENSLQFDDDEVLNFRIKAPVEAWQMLYCTVYYDNMKGKFFNRFISAREYFAYRKNRVVKCSPYGVPILLNGSGAPTFRSLASLVETYNPDSYYALLGGASHHFNFGFEKNPYNMILTGKFNGGTLLSFPMNIDANGYDYTASHFLTLAQTWNIDSIPVLKGFEFTSTFWAMYGQADGLEEFSGSLYFAELSNYRGE